MKQLIMAFSIVMITAFTHMAYSEVLVIVHPSNGDSLNAKAIAKIYLGKSSSFPSGAQVVPINMKEGNATTDEFNSKVVGKSGSQLKSYWAKLVFTGKGTPPKEVASEQEVLDLVKNNPSMIGYVPSGTDTSSVKVVGTF